MSKDNILDVNEAAQLLAEELGAIDKTALNRFIQQEKRKRTLLSKVNKCETKSEPWWKCVVVSVITY